MGQRSNFATAKDAQIKTIKEEFARGMEQRSNDASAKGVQIKLSEEECV